MPLHPRFVHFPIALLMVGSVVLVLSLHPRLRNIRDVGWLNLLLGWIALFPAIASGLIDQARAPTTEEVTRLINQHITGGIALVVIFGYALYEWLRRRDILDRPERWRVLVPLGLGIAVLVITAQWGGQLVYVFNVGRAP